MAKAGDKMRRPVLGGDPFRAHRGLSKLSSAPHPHSGARTGPSREGCGGPERPSERPCARRCTQMPRLAEPREGRWAVRFTEGETEVQQVKLPGGGRWDQPLFIYFS